WVPAYYVWTPSGYVFIDGYWDYAIVRRGVLFAPINFRRRLIFGPSYVFTPTVVIEGDALTSCLFCRPRCGCYCFGDYYAPTYYQAGIYPWYSFHRSRVGFDPVFAYYRWFHRRDRMWESRLAADFQYRRQHVEARPVHTYAAMRS